MHRLLSSILVAAVAGSLTAQETCPPVRTDVSGRVSGLGGTPARVTLWHNDMNRASVELLGDVRTGEDGAFAFDDVPWMTGFDWGFNTFALLAQAGDLVGVQELRGDRVAVDRIKLEVAPAITVRGRLRSAGEPVAGAFVWPALFGEVEGDARPTLWLTAPLPIWRARTDAEGRFELPGLPDIAPLQLRSDHDDFATDWIYADDPRRPVLAELERGGKILGRVTRPDGTPAVRVVVQAAGVGVGHGRTITDEHGAFRLTSLKEDVYKVWAEATDLTVIAVAGLAVRPGEELTDQHVRLVHGGFIVGRIVDAASGAPVRPGEDSDVAMYGPARPRGGACECTPVLPDGTFRIRAPEGSNHIYLRAAEGWSSASEDVAVVEGRETEVVWRLRRMGGQR